MTHACGPRVAPQVLAQFAGLGVAGECEFAIFWDVKNL